MDASHTKPTPLEPHGDRPPGAASGPDVGPRLDRTAHESLLSTLRGVRRRVFADRLIRATLLDLGVSLCFLGVLLLVDRTLLPGVVTPAMVSALVLISLAVSLSRTAFLTPLDLFSVAILADERLRLKARVATSLHLLLARAGGVAPAGGSSEEWERLVTQDAWNALHASSVKGGFPLRVSRGSVWILAPAVACAALALWLPSFDLVGLGARREARAEMQKTVEETKKRADEALARVEKEAQEKDAAEARRLLEMLRKASEESKKEGTESKVGAPGEPKLDAIVEMGRREELIKKAMEGRAFDPLKETLKRLPEIDLKSSDLTRKLAEALKEGDFKKAKEALQEMKEEFATLSRKSPSELSPEEKARLEKLAGELSRLSRLGAGRKDSLGKLSEALSRLASSLQSTDLPEGLKSLDLSAEALEELMRLAEDRQLLDKALEIVQLTKDELAALRECPICGTPYCPDCGKPRCACKPGTKPGGT